MREKILEILGKIKGGVDFSDCTNIIDGGYLASLDILRLVNMLGDEFDVDITASELIPENFNSVDAMVNMIEELE